MSKIDRARRALESKIIGTWEGHWKIGFLGKSDGTIIDDKIPNHLWVRRRGQTDVSARNDGEVPHIYDLPVKMWLENNSVYVIHSATRDPSLAVVPPSSPSGVRTHHHDDRYYRENEHINVSVGAADAGKPVVLDAGGFIHESMLDPADLAGYTDEQAQDAVGGMLTGNVETDIAVTYQDATAKIDFVVSPTLVGDRIHAATGKTTPVDADELGLSDSAASFVLKKLTWANLKAAIKSYYDGVTATMTNKTLTTPTISGTGFTNAQHGHTGASSGGQIAYSSLTGTPTLYTDEQAQDAVAAMIVDSSSIDFTYVDATPSLTGVVKPQGVTYAMIQNVTATDKLLGRATAGAGVVEEIALTAFARTLIDDIDAAAMRSTLGLAIGTNVQAQDAELAAIAGLVSAADKLPYFTGSGTASLADLSAFARTLIDDANQATMQATLGLVPGTNVQAQDAELAAIAGLTSAADSLPYFTGLGTAALATFTAYGRALIALADAAALRANLNVADGATAYTDEQAQDAVGAMAADTATIDVTYTDATPALTWDVKDNSITKAKMEDVATSTIRGRATAATGDPEDLTPTQVRTLLNVADGADVTGTAITALATKTTPVDADAVILTDSAASDAPKRTLWSNIKATLQTFFDGLYLLVAGKAGGQTAIGGTATGEHLTLESTAHATKGEVKILDRIRLGRPGAGLATFLSIDGSAGFARDLGFYSNSVSRILFRLDSEAESGSNAGSNWSVSTRTDAGGSLDPFAIYMLRSNSWLGLGVGVGQIFARVHVLQATLGSPVQRQQSTATGDDPIQDFLQGRAVTTNATVTTLFTMAIPASHACLLEAHVIGRRTGGASGTAEDCAAYMIRGLFNQVAGAAAIVAQSQTIIGESQAAWDCVFDVTGTDARVRVTGATGNNISWHAHVFHRFLSS